jgi:hypothetical protein
VAVPPAGDGLGRDVEQVSQLGRAQPSRIGRIKPTFLPGRNTLLLLTGAAYARQKGAGAVCIGLLFLQKIEEVLPSGTVELRARNAP